MTLFRSRLPDAAVRCRQADDRPAPYSQITLMTASMTMADSTASFRDRIFVLLQLCLPTRWLSLMVFKLTQIRHTGFKNRLRSDENTSEHQSLMRNTYHVFRLKKQK